MMNDKLRKLLALTLGAILLAIAGILGVNYINENVDKKIQQESQIQPKDKTIKEKKMDITNTETNPDVTLKL